MGPYVLVVSWTENTGIEPTGRMVWRDGNQFPEMRACPEAKALVWSRSITDRASGESFARKINGTCRLMDDTDDVLEVARAMERGST